MIPSHSCEKDKSSKNQGIIVRVTDGQSLIVGKNSQDPTCQCLLGYGFMLHVRTDILYKTV